MSRTPAGWGLAKMRVVFREESFLRIQLKNPDLVRPQVTDVDQLVIGIAHNVVGVWFFLPGVVWTVPLQLKKGGAFTDAAVN